MTSPGWRNTCFSCWQKRTIRQLLRPFCSIGIGTVAVCRQLVRDIICKSVSVFQSNGSISVADQAQGVLLDIRSNSVPPSHTIILTQVSARAKLRIIWSGEYVHSCGVGFIGSINQAQQTSQKRLDNVWPNTKLTRFSGRQNPLDLGGVQADDQFLLWERVKIHW